MMKAKPKQFVRSVKVPDDLQKPIERIAGIEARTWSNTLWKLVREALAARGELK